MFVLKIKICFWNSIVDILTELYCARHFRTGDLISNIMFILFSFQWVMNELWMIFAAFNHYLIIFCQKSCQRRLNSIQNYVLLFTVMCMRRHTWYFSIYPSCIYPQIDCCKLTSSCSKYERGCSGSTFSSLISSRHTSEILHKLKRAFQTTDVCFKVVWFGFSA